MRKFLVLASALFLVGCYHISSTEPAEPGAEPAVEKTIPEVSGSAEESLFVPEEVQQKEQIAQVSNITSFVVVKPNLIAQGENLSKVEIYVIPTGTEITPAMHGLLGNATLQSTIGNIQTWIFPISQLPQGFLATDMYARGFDMNNQAMGEEYLPVSGASELYDYLY